MNFPKIANGTLKIHIGLLVWLVAMTVAGAVEWTTAGAARGRNTDFRIRHQDVWLEMEKLRGELGKTTVTMESLRKELEALRNQLNRRKDSP